MTAAPTGHQWQHMGSQDLPALARGTKPGRLDDRIPEVVAVLSTHLTAAEADPHAHRVLTVTVVPFDALLHSHGTRHGRRRRREDHHEPVTKALYFDAAGLGEGSTQDRDVRLAKLVGSLGRHAHRH